MKHSQQERVIALAGLFQAASLVNQIARENPLDNQALKASIESLFCFNPESTLAVFANDAENIKLGLSALTKITGDSVDTEITRYVISLLAVVKLLDKQPEMLEIISKRLEHISYKREHFSDHFNDILANLSGLYQDTISKLAFRIQVHGNQHHLSQMIISDKIRASLLAGVRAAILWRQVGGTKWQLIFGRGTIEKISRQLLDNLPKESP